ncbi:hypothetical protein [uncultured Massilia sp.]|uniref:hypothetical protein n=1 Tax=uncultured Massilia sp. TaxID=169973 RepID=UPI00258B37BE|nr:hypothetical protein [uncultured Massilia sp.]
MKPLSIMAVLLTMTGPAFAQDATSQEVPAEQVQVSSIKDPELQPYRHMVRGLDAWDDKHARLAPGASLRFELWTRDGKMAGGEGLQLRLAGNEVDIGLPLDADGTFVLPRSQEALADKADLILNRKKDQFRWRPRVRTPGVPANARRLGDLRMECEVGAAVRKEEISLMLRAGAVAAGGICNLPMTAYLFRAPQRLLSATVVSGDRKSGLPLRDNGNGFQAPLRDKNWDNDALIVYEFADAAAATAKP